MAEALAPVKLTVAPEDRENAPKLMLGLTPLSATVLAPLAMEREPAASMVLFPMSDSVPPFIVIAPVLMRSLLFGVPTELSSRSVPPLRVKLAAEASVPLLWRRSVPALTVTGPASVLAVVKPSTPLPLLVRP